MNIFSTNAIVPFLTLHSSLHSSSLFFVQQKCAIAAPQIARELIVAGQAKYITSFTKQVILLGYLKDSNAAAHSVDRDIFYGVIYLSARSKTCSNIYFSK